MNLELQETLHRKRTALAFVVSVDEMTAPMLRRAGRTIVGHRTEAAFEATLIGMHAGMITQTLSGEERTRTMFTLVAALLQMRSVVFAYAGLSLEHTIAKWAFVQRLLDVRVQMPGKHRFVAELG